MSLSDSLWGMGFVPQPSLPLLGFGSQAGSVSIDDVRILTKKEISEIIAGQML
jgi:hypothetical protein